MRIDTLLQSPFAFDHPALLRARARLGLESLELSGWGLRGRYRRQIPLSNVLHADAEADRLVVWLVGGEVLRLHLKGAADWVATLNARPKPRPLPSIS